MDPFAIAANANDDQQHARNIKRQRVALLRSASPLPTTLTWMPPCVPFLENPDNPHGKNLRDAIALAAKYSDSARLVDPVNCGGDEHAKYRERTAYLTRKIRKTTVVFVKALLYRACARLTNNPPVMYINEPPTMLSGKQEDALDLIARWQLFMIWYGVGSPAERGMRDFLYEWCAKAVEDVPLCMVHIVVAMCFNLAVTENRMGGGDARMPMDVFIPMYEAADCDPHWPACHVHEELFEEPPCVYGLVETGCDDSMYCLASADLRDNLYFGRHLSRMFAAEPHVCWEQRVEA